MTSSRLQELGLVSRLQVCSHDHPQEDDQRGLCSSVCQYGLRHAGVITFSVFYNLLHVLWQVPYMV